LTACAKMCDAVCQNACLPSGSSKVSNSTNGHLAGLDANGNLTDSGFKIVTITESAYEALATKDANTLYLITES
jgi:hypothetical protein